MIVNFNGNWIDSFSMFTKNLVSPSGIVKHIVSSQEQYPPPGQCKHFYSYHNNMWIVYVDCERMFF